MNTEDYVSYPIALALKKHGFNEPCDHCYAKTDESKHEFVRMTVRRDYNKPRDAEPPFLAPICSAVPLWQAQKWLREVHSLHVDISTHGKNYWTTSITGFNDEDIPVGYLHPVNAQAFDNYESALSVGIAAALELIEKK